MHSNDDELFSYINGILAPATMPEFNSPEPGV
jgi:hypothetical protein